jgi:hypothetical protein
MTWTGADGAQLTGEHGYTVLLSPNPPVDAFWSITTLTCATPVSSPTQSIAIPSAIAPDTGEVLHRRQGSHAIGATASAWKVGNPDRPARDVAGGS